MTDPSLEDTSRYPYFYYTVPDDRILNKVRQDLLEHFGWKRVGIFSVDDEYHVSVSNKINILNVYAGMLHPINMVFLECVNLINNNYEINIIILSI